MKPEKIRVFPENKKYKLEVTIKEVPKPESVSDLKNRALRKYYGHDK